MHRPVFSIVDCGFCKYEMRSLFAANEKNHSLLRQTTNVIYCLLIFEEFDPHNPLKTQLLGMLSPIESERLLVG